MTTAQLRSLGYEAADGQRVARKIAASVERVKPKGPAIRLPKAKEPNKTEARFMEYATRYWPGRRMEFEAITFRLPSGTKYTPDVLVHPGDLADLRFVCVEVKGPFIHNARSLHAFKEARSAFPGFVWVFAQYRGGEWQLAGNLPHTGDASMSPASNSVPMLNTDPVNNSAGQSCDATANRVGKL
jgi:hypothetical protein